MQLCQQLMLVLHIQVKSLLPDGGAVVRVSTEIVKHCEHYDIETFLTTHTTA